MKYGTRGTDIDDEAIKMRFGSEELHHKPTQRAADHEGDPDVHWHKPLGAEGMTLGFLSLFCV